MLNDKQALVFATLKVANELAETNRIKRFELRQKYSTFDASEGTSYHYEEELKDHAD